MVIKKLILLLFLSIVAWQDFKAQSIKLWVYVVFSIFGFCIIMLQEPFEIFKIILACTLPGFLLLALHKISRGAVGEGDGWFFIVSGLFLSVKENLYLLFYGLLLCSAWCVLLIIWGMVKGVNVRKYRIPFLPFLLPVGIWLVNV